MIYQLILKAIINFGMNPVLGHKGTRFLYE